MSCFSRVCSLVVVVVVVVVAVMISSSSSSFLFLICLNIVSVHVVVGDVALVVAPPLTHHLKKKMEQTDI